MALMFPRLAQNFAKNGYYPTDEKTLECILSFLAPLSDDSHTQIFDPCAGEGVALAEVKHRLGTNRTRAFGIEYDEERSYHAKNLLDVCVHGDMQDCIVKRNQFGLLFLNPPYGDLVSDHAQLSEKQFSGRDRLEKLFYQSSFQSLAFGGLMILIIPDYTLDKEYAGWLVKHFTDLSVFRASDQAFKQLVIFGKRQRTSNATNVKAIRTALLEIESVPEIPLLTQPWFDIPSITTDNPLVHTKMDAQQLSDELGRIGNKVSMWNDFDIVFNGNHRSARRPVMELSDWHMALALAAGQVIGHVTSNDGNASLLIKGGTHKEKEVKTVVNEGSDGSMSEIHTHLDRFISVITGINTTRGSEFGDIVTIR